MPYNIGQTAIMAMNNTITAAEVEDTLVERAALRHWRQGGWNEHRALLNVASLVYQWMQANWGYDQEWGHTPYVDPESESYWTLHIDGDRQEYWSLARAREDFDQAVSLQKQFHHLTDGVYLWEGHTLLDSVQADPVQWQIAYLWDEREYETCRGRRPKDVEWAVEQAYGNRRRLVGHPKYHAMLREEHMAFWQGRPVTWLTTRLPRL